MIDPVSEAVYVMQGGAHVARIVSHLETVKEQPIVLRRGNHTVELLRSVLDSILADIDKLGPGVD